MSLRDLVLKNRSYRRFEESRAITREELLGLVDLARQCASGGNKQPLKYLLSHDSETNAKIFPSLKWAGALKDWDGPVEGERPSAYILILVDKEIASSPGCDHGIAAQTIHLGAVEAGLGGCMLGAIDRGALRADLAIPERYDISLALALGRPSETVVIDPVGPDGDTTYSRDANDVHHVPKRSLEQIVVGF
jgi:nitroreductase